MPATFGVFLPLDGCLCSVTTITEYYCPECDGVSGAAYFSIRCRALFFLRHCLCSNHGTGISAEPLAPELIGAIRVLISPETARAYSRPMPTRLDGRELSDRLFAEYLEELLTVGCRSASRRSGQPLRPVAPTLIVLVVAAARFVYRLVDAECLLGPLIDRALDGIRNEARVRGTG